MGWLYKQHPVTDPVAYLTGQYNHDGEHRTYRVLGAARVSNTVYMAVKSTDKATDQSYVFAAVVLISNTQKDGFGYKDMDESVGPCECACPDRIMRLLSPIADIPNPGYAADWRARVAAQKTAAVQLRTKRKRLMPGAIVTLQNEVRFRDGKTATAFRMRFFQRKTPIFEPLDRPGYWCRLSRASLAAATVTPPAATAVAAPA
jgi:hypothetical protein